MTLLEPTETRPTETATATHEHAWQTRSSHRTSTGVVRYVSCVSCGGNRIDVQQHADEPPAAVSRVVGGEDSGPAAT
ncbi:hypothetical protein [Pseudactinotalea terrae]|uniref:hypothetical protein n=1 Tax=Pseudactinotalea terrae TaxID=1743262 RepID=UPI0012E1F7F6|nr:hypothetical protein [Pseudactinotalea terrae]